MRSRYTAFALGLPVYLRASWAPETRPTTVELDPQTVWRGLQIVDVERGGPDDDTGVVEFRARYRDPSGGGFVHERSRFRRDAGRWGYVDGGPGRI